MLLLTIIPVVFILPSKSPTQSESTCTWKSSCINSMGSSFLRPVITQHTLANSVLTANVLALDRHCSATMFGVFLRRVAAVLNSALLCSTVNGPPTAFPLIGSQCTVGVLTGTHWVPTDTQAGWYQGQSANPLAAATAETASLHACARDQHTLDKLSQTCGVLEKILLFVRNGFPCYSWVWRAG